MFILVTLLLLLIQSGTDVVNCPAGRGGKLCASCPAGTYKDTWGLSDCIYCPLGTVSIIIGATSLSTCTPCVEGTYASNSIECLPCPLYTISPPASSSIMECMSMEGYYSNPGQVGTLCPSGFYCPQSIMKPIPCPSGLYSPTGAVICTSKESVSGYRWVEWNTIVLILWVSLVIIGITYGAYKYVKQSPKDPPMKPKIIAENVIY